MENLIFVLFQLADVVSGRLNKLLASVADIVNIRVAGGTVSPAFAGGLTRAEIPGKKRVRNPKSLAGAGRTEISKKQKMKRKKLSGWMIHLLWLLYPCLPVTGQPSAGTEIRSVKVSEAVRPWKAEAVQPGERPEAGQLQLRAAERPWPDSTVTFTAAGEPTGKTVYTYDAAGNRTLYEYYRREGNTWVNSSKTVYTYDAAGNRTLYEYYRWEGNTWVNSSKTVYAYDAAGNNTLYEYYYWENGQWTGSSKYTYAYDDKGLKISGQYKWTNNQWVKSLEEYYDRKAADSKVYIDVSVYYNEDGSRGGNALFVSGSGLNWATVWPEEYKMEYKATYDSSGSDGKLIRVETTVLRDGTRVPGSRYVLKYSNNNPVAIEVYVYDGNGQLGDMDYKASCRYDAGGHLTSSESYSWAWDSVSEEMKWEGLDKTASTYDANGNQLSYESYSWDTSSDSWTGSYKDASTYDANGNQLSYEYYRWDTSSGGWTGSSKTDYERSDDGAVIRYKSYSWNGGGWECTSYTVYYPESDSPDGTEYIEEAEPAAYICGDVLHVRTACAERIEIYTLNGSKIYEGSVAVGTTRLSAGRLPKGVLIVRGSSGWTMKVMNN
jgi:hypothetical protein